MSFTSKLDMRKLEALIRRVDKINNTAIDSGFFAEDRYGPENKNLYAAQVAWFNERGTRTNPRRPFMRDTFTDKANHLALANGMVKVFESTILNGRLVQRLLRELGQQSVDMLRSTIISYPGSNSEETIRRKGRNSPLRDTEFMLNSVKFKLG